MGECYRESLPEALEMADSTVSIAWKRLELSLEVLSAGIGQLPLHDNTVDLLTVVEVLWAIVLREYAACDEIAYDRVITVGEKVVVSRISMKLDEDQLALLPESPSLASLIAARGARDGVKEPFFLRERTDDGIESDTAIWITNKNVEGKPSSPPQSAGWNIVIGVEDDELGGRPLATLWYRSSKISDGEAQDLAGTLQQSMRSLPAAYHRSINHLDLLSTYDRDLLRKWMPPRAESQCQAVLLPDMLAEAVQMYPNAPSIEASDGCWTYFELQEACHALALHLCEVGVEPGEMVLLMREKSKWTVAAMIAILMAGAICVPVDIRQAKDRIQRIIESTSSRFVLTSELVARKRDTWAPLREICVNIPTTAGPSTLKLPHLPSDATAFVFFTSGSTGVPKGVVQGHRAVALTAEQISRAMGMDSRTRTFQYASYSFDVSVGDIFATIFAGGCLCIPSEESRLDELSKTINAMEATHICVTSTTIAKLNPEKMPSLRQVTVGGEPLTKEQLQAWYPRIATIYGTTESVIWDTYHANLAIEDSPTNIGRGMGPTSTWIVDVWSAEKLVPVGAVGELLIGGPLLSKGYLNDEERTKVSFVENPPWLAEFVAADSVQRLYRTGDLVRYNPDGTIQFLGRKDRQIKVNGQRVELGDIEYALRQTFPNGTACAAEMIRPSFRHDQDVLAAFVGVSESALEAIESSLTSVRNRMAELLPMYMIPSLFVPLENGLPTTSTGKVDRSRLRQLGSSLSTAQLLQDHDEHNARRDSLTPQEILIQNLCAEALGIRDSSLLDMNANFFQSGATSIHAMQLVSLARSKGFYLSAIDIFENPRLADLAAILQSSTGKACGVQEPRNLVAPFSLLPSKVDQKDVQRVAASSCGLQPSQVQDVFPCTELQEGMLALSSKSLGDYIQQAVIEIPPTVDLEHFKKAYERTADRISLLRCRAFALPEANHRLYMAVVDQREEWRTVCAIGECSNSDRQQMSLCHLGDRLVRCSLVVDSAKKQYFVWTLHHALFDGWSLSLMLDELESQLRGSAAYSLLPFQNFVHYLQDEMDYDSCRSFWRSRLDGAEQLLFPPTSSPARQPSGCTATLRHTFCEVPWPSIGVTPSVMIQGAWAVLLSQQTGALDVVFGSTVIGRHAAVPGIEQIVGPTIATIPQRVNLDPNQSIPNFLERLQLETIRAVPYEQLGLAGIAKVSADARNASAFQTLLVVQPPDDSVNENPRLLDRSQVNVMGTLRTYAVSIQCWLGSSGSIDFQMDFDESALNHRQGEKLLTQLEAILRRLCANSSKVATLSAILSCSDADMLQISRWNMDQPMPPLETVLDLIAAQVAAHPDRLAVDAWDGSLTYRELDHLASRLAQQILTDEEQPKSSSAVVVCLEKSQLAVVAMIAIFRAGKVCVLVDAANPSQRVKTIIGRSKARLALTDQAQSSRLSRWVRAITISKESLSSELSSTLHPFPQCLPTDDACMVFTSGSTGQPKAISWSHQTVAANALGIGAEFCLSSRSRVFQFSSYAFDVSIHETTATLVHGGCICVPSEESRRDTLEQSIVSLKASTIILTPSVAQVLSPENLTCLETVIFCGEPLPVHVALEWSKIMTVYNWYGPGECSLATCCRAGELWEAGQIGVGTSTMTWIVHEQDHDILQPIGAIGELLLQGPCVASRYAYDDARTAQSFIDQPRWWQHCTPGMVATRLYKTGDLARYADDGSIILMGRKDAQVKIRGQRVELGEVESRLQEVLQIGTGVAVDLIHNRADHEAPILAAFIERSHAEQDNHVAPVEWSQTIQAQLTETLPQWMVPSIFFILRETPCTLSGKIDRQQLQALGTSLFLQSLATTNNVKDDDPWMPSTPAETVLSTLWIEVLGLSSTQLAPNAHFIRLGGNSIDAMRLSAAARRMGYSLSVRDVLMKPYLSALAQQMQYLEPETSAGELSVVLPFALAPARARLEAAAQCKLPAEQISDVFPCTSLQTALLASTARRPGDYISRNIYRIDADLDLFKASWEAIVATTPILRTRIVDLGEEDLYQAIIDAPLEWNLVESPVHNSKHGQRIPMGLGTPLVRWEIAPHTREQASSFILIWTIHHSLYDGWSFRAILDQVERAYRRQTLPSKPPFQGFIKYTSSLKMKPAVEEFWKRRLDDVEASNFPVLPSVQYEPRATSTLEHRSTFSRIASQANHANYTMNTLLRAAWSLVLARYSRSSDVVFGTTVLGRQVPVADVTDMIGPTIATIPVRVRWSANDTLQTLLESIHQEGIESIPFEQIGLQRLRSLGPGPEQACMFQTMLIVQPPREQNCNSAGLFDDFAGDDSVGLFSSTALMLRCSLTSSGVNNKDDATCIRFHLDSDPLVVDEEQARQILHQMGHTLSELSFALPSTKLCNLQLLSNNDLEQIMLWNGNPPEPVDATVIELFSDAVQKFPAALAVDAWDAELTYEELDRYATNVAHVLVSLGLQSLECVPLYFEKSAWVVVAILGVLKVGGTVVLLEPSHPVDRLRSVLHRIKAPLIITSVKGVDSARHLSPSLQAVVVDASFKTSPPSPMNLPHPQIDSSSPLYVVFTSGSTGVPKGVIITHGNICSAWKYRHPRLSYKCGDRILDGVSYAFDVSWGNILFTLCSGACLCIPTTTKDIGASLRDSRATVAGIPPSLVRQLDYRQYPSMRVMTLGSETPRLEDKEGWAQHVDVFNSYGPAECTVSVSVGLLNEESRVHVGRGMGATMWIVDDTMDSTCLASIGSIGELWIEGPQVGFGYLDDPKGSAAAFIEHDPTWLPAIPTNGHTEKKRRFYRTGDLAQYYPDGMIRLVGRRDTQAKLRGQRIELEEVEHHVKKHLPSGVEIAAEVIVPQSSPSRQFLVMFVVPNCASGLSEHGVKSLRHELQAKLIKGLPSYMCPSAYIPIPEFPRLAAGGKVHRGRLRELGATLSVEELTQPTRNPHDTNKEKLPPRTPVEKQLQGLWATTLGLIPNAIGAEDSFLQLDGGDSISTMRLVRLAQEHGFCFSVADVFSHPKLCDLATKAVYKDTSSAPTVPFSLTRAPWAEDRLREEAARRCDIFPEQIEDIFPCTALQEGLLALTSGEPSLYACREKFELHEHVDASRFREAWDRVAASMPILRTRIIDLHAHGLYQVVVNEGISWKSEATKHTFGLGSRLVHWALIEEAGSRQVVWTIHHSLYDGWTIPKILEQVEKAYFQAPLQPYLSMQPFIQYLSAVDQGASRTFWTAQLSEAPPPSFPALPAASYQPRATGSHIAHISNLDWPVGISPSIWVRAAWSLLIGHIVNTDDITFGATVSGRQISLAGIQDVIGPTIATLPVRVRIDWAASIHDFALQLQQQAVDMIPFEQIGLHNLRHISEDAKHASQFRTLLNVQSAPAEALSTRLWTRKNDELQGQFNDFALILDCELQASGILLRLDFDPEVIRPRQAERLVHQLEAIILQLDRKSLNLTTTLADIHPVSGNDIAEIWEWNASVPEEAAICLHDTIHSHAFKSPTSPAVDAWDGQLTYEALDQRSTSLASYLQRQFESEVSAGCVISLCFEKSMWTVVAALAVMKTGGAFTLMDASQPEERLRTIASQVNQSLIISSALNAELAARLAKNVVVVDESNFMRWPSPQPLRMRALASSNLYVVFTSGSTGTPKGAIITHSNFSSAVKHQGAFMDYNPQTRVYDFASYSFDIAVSNLLHCLAAGGCLCIPSDAERKQSQLAESMERLHVNLVDLTPSVARALDPTAVPSLRTLILGGETALRSDIVRWAPYVRVLNGIGQAECTVTTTMAVMDPAVPGTPGIGRAMGTNVWIVNPTNHNQLSAIGAVGELLVEGPLVGAGYLNDEDKTSAAFIRYPNWLALSPSSAGRAPHGKLYKTGDLVRYDEDGGLYFIGRKDAQAKIRGQRIELEEVEYHVHRLLLSLSVEASIAAEALVLSGASISSAVLVVFICPAMVVNSQQHSHDDSGLSLLDSSTFSHRVRQDLNSRLESELPSAMIPFVCVPVNRIPLSPTGKTDRKRLKALGSSLTVEQLAEFRGVENMPQRSPSTSDERRLRDLWAEVLAISADSIGIDDSFIQLGGDSISAMRLVSIAKKHGFVLDTRKLLSAASALSMLAATSNHAPAPTAAKDELPFGQLNTDDAAGFCEANIAPHIDYPVSKIVDVFPVTEFQADCIKSAVQRSPPSFWNYFFIDFRLSDVAVDALSTACQAVAMYFPILRTVFVPFDDGYLQVVTKDWVPEFEEFNCMANEKISEASKRIAREDWQNVKVKFGTRFCKFMLIRADDEPETARFIIRMSHSLYDGISLGPLVEALTATIEQRKLPPAGSFASFIKHSRSLRDEACRYWGQLLSGSSMTSFPVENGTKSSPYTIRRTVAWRRPLPQGITPATFYTACWAAVIASATRQDDIVFGRLVSGRGASLDAIADPVAGPCLNVVPLRATWPRDGAYTPYSPHEVFDTIQNQQFNGMLFESTGLSDIVPSCTGWPENTMYGSVFQYQNIDETIEAAVSGLPIHLGDIPMEFRPEELWMLVKPNEQGIDVQLFGATGIMAQEKAQLLADNFCKFVGMGGLLVDE